MTAIDPVNHPPHYTDGWSNDAEVIDITENLSFNRGNAVKYIARAGKKDPSKELEDLRKAEFYLQREISRVETFPCPRTKGTDSAAVPKINWGGTT